MKSFLPPSVCALLTFCLFACGGKPQMTAIPPAMINVPGTPAGPTPGPSATQSPGATTQCPAGEYDMLDWATLDPDLAVGYHLEGNHNPLYTFAQSDKFYWMKAGSGFPWDIQLVDTKNIYLWITEQTWNDPHTFKKSHDNTNMALTPRCAAGGQSQPGTHVKSANTSYEIVNSCSNGIVSNLGTMNNEVWGPYKMSFGGDIPNNIDTLVVAYKYDCDANYANCNDREQFYLTQRYGLVRWDHSRLSGGQYVQDNYTVYNKLVRGGPPAPQFPCG